jgi:hypothetical protein
MCNSIKNNPGLGKGLGALARWVSPQKGPADRLIGRPNRVH